MITEEKINRFVRTDGPREGNRTSVLRDHENKPEKPSSSPAGKRLGKLKTQVGREKLVRMAAGRRSKTQKQTRDSTGLRSLQNST